MAKHADFGGSGEILTRPRYFPRQVVTAADLNGEQGYFRELLRRHNRYLHGCGVVCGLEVLVGKDASGGPVVRVTPGHAIDPQGNDIHVPIQLTLKLGQASAGGACTGGEARCVYLALRYDEVLIEPVPTLVDDCTPGAAQEPSRARASFELACLTDLPEGCWATPPCGVLTWEISRSKPAADPGSVPPDCPPEGRDPWVVLAALDLNALGHVVNVDYGVRRQVLSMQILVDALRCLLPRIDRITPPAGMQDSSLIAFVIGERLRGATAVRFSAQGIAAEVLAAYGQDNRVAVRLWIEPDAPLGPRTFEVTTPRGTVDSVACGVAFTVLSRMAYPYPYPYGYGYLGGADTFYKGIGGDLL